MLVADFSYSPLDFKRPSGTSRGILTKKEAWFVHIWDDKDPKVKGIGECSIIRGLSPDDRENYEEKIQEVCDNINEIENYLDDELIEWPSIYFGFEMALRDLVNGGKHLLFNSDFTESEAKIPINGLVWMGDDTFMRKQVKEKIEAGFNCIKLKIGAIDFQTEINILKSIRKEFSISDIELRVDANGAFSAHEALEKLKRLSEYQLHSIEQPIKPKQFEDMANLCEVTPLPIALDEELIGVLSKEDKLQVIHTIKPQYIILKPSLVGGFGGSKQWITIAEDLNIKWWITSALESNVGLNAIAQWTYTLNNTMPQGLGTGSLFTNNFTSPLTVKNGTLQYDINKNWNFNLYE